MDYEKGKPKNLVQFSQYNDLAFTDTGVTVDDNSQPDKNILWSSDRIDKRIRELTGINGGVNANANANANAGVNANVNYSMMKYKPKVKFGFFKKIFSFFVRSRSYYCDKCCNYIHHFRSSVYKDDPTLANQHNCNMCKN